MAKPSTLTWGPLIRLDSTKSPFDSPLPQTHKAFAGVKPVSWKRHNVAGLLVTTYGVEELPRHPRRIVCLWLLHARGDTQDSMAFVAAAFLAAWNTRRRSREQDEDTGLICAGFDQRNHGSRMVEERNNNSWKQGNPTHGQDMFNSYSGTARDLSLMITQLPTYLPFAIDEHICGGVSLGGHATWVALMTEPRIAAGLVVVGCPDYVRLMVDRAIRSNLPSAVNSTPRGKDFLGSKDFPPSLLDAIARCDPAAVFSKAQGARTSLDLSQTPTKAEVQRLRATMQRTLAGKKILCLSGGEDRLVPYAQGEPFLTWLKNSINQRDGWCHDLGVEVEDTLEPTGRHEFSAFMRSEAERWLCELLSERRSGKSKQSKI